MFNIIIGDLIQLMLNKQVRYMAHGCNCYCRMRSGFAAGIHEHFYEAVDIDAKTAVGDRNKMGGYTTVFILRNNVQIFNLYTQFRYGSPSQNNFEIDAYAAALKRILPLIPEDGQLHIPAIGAGLGGGDIHEIISVTEGVLQQIGRKITMVIQPDSPLIASLGKYLEL